MSFEQKTWTDRKTEYPNRRILTKEDGSTELVTVSRSEGTTSAEGDAFSAENMNDLENRIKQGFEDSDSNIRYLSESEGDVIQLKNDAGEWVDWKKAGLGSVNFLMGNTSDWIQDRCANYSSKTFTISESLMVNKMTSSQSGWLRMRHGEKIDFTDYTVLRVKGTLSRNDGHFRLKITDNIDTETASVAYYDISTGDFDNEFDISAISGEHYIEMQSLFGNGTYVNVEFTTFKIGN